MSLVLMGVHTNIDEMLGNNFANFFKRYFYAGVKQ